VNQTKTEYFEVIKRCRSIFIRKAIDYGTSWKILRLPSLTDQIFIKAQRIRSIEETLTNKVGDSIEGEYVGIVNYCVIAQMLLEMNAMSEAEHEVYLSPDGLAQHYDRIVERTYALLEMKNHDYGEAWREMRMSSLTDMILTKVLRLKQIEDNNGKTLISEGPEGSYMDMLNYAVFALIRLNYTLKNDK